MALYAGSAVQLINSVQPVREIIETMVSTAREALRLASRACQHRGFKTIAVVGPYFSILLCSCQKRSVRSAVSADNLPPRSFYDGGDRGQMKRRAK
jgi:hypothetical protein